MHQRKVLTVLAIVGILTSFATMAAAPASELVKPAAENGEDDEIWLPPYEGYPDPFACAEFTDCEQTMPVCIEGVTWVVGIFFDPEELTPEEIADLALEYSETVLTAGACSQQPSEPVVGLAAVMNESHAAYPDSVCFIGYRAHQPAPSDARILERTAVWCTGQFGADWVEGASVIHKSVVFSNDYWEGDALLAEHSFVERLPLWGEGGLYETLMGNAPWVFPPE